MNIKVTHLNKVLEHLKYKAGLDSKDTLDFTVREEDIENNKLCGCLILKCTTTKNPGQYDDFIVPLVQEWTIEIYAEHENRPPRITLNQTTELNLK